MPIKKAALDLALEVLWFDLNITIWIAWIVKDTCFREEAFIPLGQPASPQCKGLNQKEIKRRTTEKAGCVIFNVDKATLLPAGKNSC